MDEEIAILAAIENLENQEDALEHVREVHSYRNALNTMTDTQFVKLFRLPKYLVQELLHILAPYVSNRPRVGLSREEKILIALNFFATGGYQTNVGDSKHLGVCQASVSRAIQTVTDALNQPQIFNRYVRFPRNVNELNILRKQFHNKYGMPGIIGCVDCTHVAIVPPKANDPLQPEHIYINRKHYHSINVQLVCDASLKIMHVNARFPGSTHDSHIWRTSNVKAFLINLYERGHDGYFLLGDSGYPLRPWILTPLENPDNVEEDRYNNCHKSARSTIERCNGLLKMRFRCLLKHRVLHYSPEKCSKIINACVVLHNMCVENNVQLILADEEQNEEADLGVVPVEHDNFNVPNPRAHPFLAAGRRMQRRIINHFR